MNEKKNTPNTIIPGVKKSIVEILFDVGIEFDIIFSPLFTNVNEWERGLFKEFPIYNEIVNDGALVQ